MSDTGAKNYEGIIKIFWMEHTDIVSNKILSKSEFNEYMHKYDATLTYTDLVQLYCIHVELFDKVVYSMDDSHISTEDKDNTKSAMLRAIADGVLTSDMLRMEQAEIIMKYMKR